MPLYLALSCLVYMRDILFLQEVEPVRHYFFEQFMLFGFNGQKSSLIGGWSIGVEFVFYFLFPLIVLVIKDDIRRAVVLTLISVFMLYVTSVAFDTSIKLGEQNQLYIMPINHFFFFMSGCLLGVIYKQYHNYLTGDRNKIQLLIAIFVLFLLISLLGENQEQVELMGSSGRILISTILVLLVSLMLFVRMGHRTVVFLGEISYAVYLIHPFMVFGVLAQLNLENVWLKFLIVLSGTVLLSFLSYRYFEVPTQRLIRKLANA